MQFEILRCKILDLRGENWDFREDFEKIDLAIKIIKSTKNFESFCKSNSGVSNYECEIIDFYYEIDSSNIIFTIQANRFLRNMVRSIMGTIIEIGIGKTTLEELKYIITKSNRIYAGPSLPAHALFLEKIYYGKDIYLWVKKSKFIT